MKKPIIFMVLAAAGLASAAQAQRGPDPWGDATVSRADEEAKAGERFDALDTNKDGVIAGAEMTAAQEQRGPGGGLRRADSNGDGKVTRQEYLDAQLQRFDQQDANKDGQLTKAERDAARAERMREGWGGPPPGGE